MIHQSQDPESSSDINITIISHLHGRVCPFMCLWVRGTTNATTCNAITTATITTVVTTTTTAAIRPSATQGKGMKETFHAKFLQLKPPFLHSLEENRIILNWITKTNTAEGKTIEIFYVFEKSSTRRF